MKTSIKLSALFLLLSAGVFATTAAKAVDVTPKAKEVVTFKALDHDRGVKLILAKSENGRSFIRVYSKQNELLLKDVVSTKTDVERGYVLTNLEDGDYIMEVKTNNQVVKKTLHVYEDGDQKTFFIYQD
ncbi:hypothetical protein ACRQ5D_13905 [Mucilaginibacter sp. P25]|uniref:Por secretion system C-terminal sorting domain-containing protein n=1 Tax=Mucilaginibacter gossypii TaxID=551996 RepID=A0A1G8FQT9_9SPHI|nr:hypothetical protein [Mucilaginibacter gossypii]SDH84522.1 hypothetical protein SAMN05192573_11334 [Mucilaginibacter gossypii]